MQSSPEARRGTIGGHPTALPLPTLLSQVLAAFTIEFDNEFEHQMPNRVTRLRAAGEWNSGLSPRPWLVSMVMWSNLMRFVTEDGLTVSKLQVLAHTAKLSLKGMERWGYIRVGPDPD